MYLFILHIFLVAMKYILSTQVIILIMKTVRSACDGSACNWCSSLSILTGGSALRSHPATEIQTAVVVLALQKSRGRVVSAYRIS
ncbi:hypothetical protein BDZ91DRAFT_725399 [Kalaharituber pfeilii]|nr:hypothetical protein BDZ91DRAFT_725399 [Kalaharituber pfeilii]